MSVIRAPESWFYRQIRKLKAVFSIVMKAKQFQMKQLEKSGLPCGTKMAIGTQGFGYMGERYPVSKQNLDSYTKMEIREEVWFRNLNLNDPEVKEAKEVFNLLTRGVEVDLTARSHTEKTILGPTADAIGEFVEKIEKAYETAEEEEGEEYD